MTCVSLLTPLETNKDGVNFNPIMRSENVNISVLSTRLVRISFRFLGVELQNCEIILSSSDYVKHWGKYQLEFNQPNEYIS